MKAPTFVITLRYGMTVQYSTVHTDVTVTYSSKYFLKKIMFLEKAFTYQSLKKDYYGLRKDQRYQELGQLKKFEETADFNRYKKELKWYEDVKSKKTVNTTRQRT